MKMIMAILHKDDELETIEELNIAGYMVTKLATTGGFLKKKSTTIMVVVDDEKVAEALKIIKKNSGERKDDHLCKPGIDLRTEQHERSTVRSDQCAGRRKYDFCTEREQMEKY